MKFIEPTVEIYEEKNPLKKIERIARVCTASERLITENSAKPFCQKLIDMKHFSPFEHAWIKISYDRALELTKHIEESGNFLPYGYLSRALYYPSEKKVALNGRDFLAGGGTLEELENCEISDKVITAFFTIDIGISRELLRHREMSFMERSTRYVEMSDLEIVRPRPYDFGNDYPEQEEKSSRDKLHQLQAAAESAERAYSELLSLGCKKQEARLVLPLATATRLYMTGRIDQWSRVFDLRLGSGAHPSMKYIMDKLSLLFSLLLEFQKQ